MKRLLAQNGAHPQKAARGQHELGPRLGLACGRVLGLPFLLLLLSIPQAVLNAGQF